jgi:5-methyltetrahydropteroyltriglutamate--homocysteine methyltransferase
VNGQRLPLSNLSGDPPMKRSSQRILSTHIGSLPRPKALWELIDAKDRNQAYDESVLNTQLKSAVTAIVRRQVEVGIDIPSDGEQSKASFTNYVRERLTGLEGINTERYPEPPSKYPAYDEAMRTRGPNLVARLGTMPLNTGPLSWKNRDELDTDIRNFKEALKGLTYEEAFMPSVAVGQVFFMVPTKYFSSDRDYLYALADMLRDEYKAITDAGLVLQVDSPDFVMMRNRQYWNRDWNDYRKSIELRVEALNHALQDVPEDRIRFHVCWGNFEGPHDNDVALKDVVDLVLRVKAEAYSLEGANPRHAHEWQVWEKVKFPAGKILIPGVIDTVTTFVEHPELVAQRIVQYANIVGRENVIAAPDCGFGTFGGWEPRVHPEIMWAKFGSLVEGARIATGKLWGRASVA